MHQRAGGIRTMPGTGSGNNLWPLTAGVIMLADSNGISRLPRPDRAASDLATESTEYTETQDKNISLASVFSVAS